MFHLDSLRNIIQSLPKWAATSIFYLLPGALPIETELEQRHIHKFAVFSLEER